MSYFIAGVAFQPHGWCACLVEVENRRYDVRALRQGVQPGIHSLVGWLTAVSSHEGLRGPRIFCEDRGDGISTLRRIHGAARGGAIFVTIDNCPGAYEESRQAAMPELVGTLRLVLEERRLRVAEALPGARGFLEELGRTGDVLQGLPRALAIGLWPIERTLPIRVW